MAATRWLLVVFTFATAICVGLGSAADQPEKKKTKGQVPAVLRTPMKPDDGDDELRKVQVAHYNTLMAYLAKLYRIGGEDVTSASRRFLRLGLDLRERPQDKIDFSKQCLEWVQEVHARVKDRADAPFDSSELQWREHVQEIEVEYAKAKKAAKKPEK